MKLMRSLYEKLAGVVHRDAPDEAIAAVDDATTSVRSLRQQLEPFRLEIDPFAAISRKQLMTNDYESGQMGSIHRGPVP